MKMRISEILKQKYTKGLMHVGLNIDNLEDLLVKEIPKYSNDDELILAVSDYLGRSAARHKATSSEWNEDELEEIVIILNAFLSSSPSLPSTIVADVHSYKGMIFKELHQYNDSISSFMKALWIQSMHKNTPPVDVALTEHRLGLSYGENGDYKEAISILEKALDVYKKNYLKNDHYLVINASEAFNYFRYRHLKRFMFRQSSFRNLQNRQKFIDYAKSA